MARMVEAPCVFEVVDARSGVLILPAEPLIDKARSRGPREEHASLVARSREDEIRAEPSTTAFLRGVVLPSSAREEEDDRVVREAGLTVSGTSARRVGVLPDVLCERGRFREGVRAAAFRAAELGTAGFFKVSSETESPPEAAAILRARPGVMGSLASVSNGVSEPAYWAREEDAAPETDRAAEISRAELSKSVLF